MCALINHGAQVCEEAEETQIRALSRVSLLRYRELTVYGLVSSFHCCCLGLFTNVGIGSCDKDFLTRQSNIQYMHTSIHILYKHSYMHAYIHTYIHTYLDRS